MLVHRRVTPSIKFAGVHLYIWVERDAVTVECPRLGLEPRPLDPESSSLTMRPPRLPKIKIKLLNYSNLVRLFADGTLLYSKIAWKSDAEQF